MHQYLREVIVVSQTVHKEPTTSLIIAGGYQLRENLDNDLNFYQPDEVDLQMQQQQRGVCPAEEIQISSSSRPADRNVITANTTIIEEEKMDETIKFHRADSQKAPSDN